MRNHDLLFPIKALIDEMEEARAKFPSNALLMEALVEEVGEIARAVQDRDFKHARQEALHAACVAMRLATEGDQSWAPSREEDRFTVQQMVEAFWNEMKPKDTDHTQKSFTDWVQGLLQRPKGTNA